jgi:membrane associated rhomboid family serine protease
MFPIRDENPSRTFPFVTYGLIALNVVAWLWEWALLSRGAPVVELLGVVPVRLLADPFGDGYTIFTSMFLHGGWMHLLGNMLFLYIFGDNVEDAIGHARYFFFYLVAGVAAAAAQMLVEPASAIPMVGASGAIAGVLGAYLVLYPRAPVVVLFPPIFIFEFPAWLVILEFFVMNVLNAFLSLWWTASMNGGTAFFAHVGGFVFGLLAVRALCMGREVRAARSWDGWRSPPRTPRRMDQGGPRRDPWLS